MRPPDTAALRSLWSAAACRRFLPGAVRRSGKKAAAGRRTPKARAARFPRSGDLHNHVLPPGGFQTFLLTRTLSVMIRSMQTLGTIFGS